MKALLEKRECPGCGKEYRPVGKSQVYHSTHCEKQAQRRALTGLDAGERVLYKGHEAIVRERKGLKVKLLVMVQPPAKIQNEEGEVVPNPAKPYSFVTWAQSPQIERVIAQNSEVEIPKLSEFEGEKEARAEDAGSQAA